MPPAFDLFLRFGTALAIGFLIAGLILPNAIPSVTPLLPWALHPIAANIAMEGTMAPDAWMPILLTALWTLLCLLLALWRFEREEL